MIRRPPISTHIKSSAASDVYKRQEMRAYKTGSATYQYSFHSKYFYCLLKRRCLFVLFMVTNVTDLLKINNFRRGYFKKKQI